jgi:hypothetical protein
MVDPRLLRLLHHCDDFLQRQRTLLDQSDAPSRAGSIVAMGAAADQFAHAVDLAWRAVILQLVEETDGELDSGGPRLGGRPPMQTGPQPMKPDPGE